MKLSPEARCQQNVEALFHELDYAPRVIAEDPLQPRSDRCYLEWSGGLAALLDSRMDRWDAKIEAHRPLGVVTAECGWRERRATWAAQVIEHCVSDVRFYEVDFDDGNPAWGVAPALLHFIQWARWKVCGYRTDPFAVARKRGWA